MQTKDVGLAGLRGWRNSLANTVAPQVAKRSPLGEDQVRAAVGAIFLVLSLMYVVGALKDLVGETD
ncbi:MAG: hypothetical protein WA964_08245 [Ilumatobacter sp.]|uniref:hypothetical protein n=1 Tax=Ilumatobacter sp. TaxID=1967498 RepID=UPI003C75B946